MLFGDDGVESADANEFADSCGGADDEFESGSASFAGCGDECGEELGIGTFDLSEVEFDACAGGRGIVEDFSDEVVEARDASVIEQ